MKRAISLIASLLQLVLLAGAVALPILEKKFMGFMRFLVNKNRVWNAAPLAAWLPYLLAGLLAAALVWGLVKLFGQKANGHKRPLALLAACCLVAAGFVLFACTAYTRAYWFISAILAVIAALQWVKCLCATGRRSPVNK